MKYIEELTPVQIKENSNYLRKFFNRYPISSELEYYHNTGVPKKMVSELVPRCKRPGCKMGIKPLAHRKYCSIRCRSLAEFERRATRLLEKKQKTLLTNTI